MDEGHAISYKLLQRGTPVHASDGKLVGTVALVLENKREHIFDGINVDTAAGPRFVDAPEVARITERLVTLSIDSEAAGALPQPTRAAPEYAANPRAGKLARILGGSWRRR
jgi:hypothetical protein